MDVKSLVTQWVTRITAMLFSLVIVFLIAISTTAVNSVSIVVLWFLSFLFWALYSGHELMIMFRVLFLFILKKIRGNSLFDAYDEDSLLEALVFFKSRMYNMWDGHIIPFLIYLVFTSMVFGVLTNSIYTIVSFAVLMYICHTLFRHICINIIQYSK